MKTSQYMHRDAGFTAFSCLFRSRTPHSRWFKGVLLALAIGAAACGKKTDEAHDHEHHSDSTATAAAGDWKAMDDFHMVMAESFHPYKDSANLVPAKANAVELAKQAQVWANAPLPEKVDTDEMKTKLQKLNNDTQLFVDQAKTGDDKVVAEALTSLHDQFHAIQEMWYGGKGAHHHH